MSRPKVFISYSHADKDFVRRLYRDLKKRGAEVWIDEKDRNVGDSITEAIENALSKADFFCLILSANSTQRPWVKREYRTALTLQLSTEGQHPRILPIVIDNVNPPALLRDIRHADFRRSYVSGFEKLCRAIGLRTKPAPFLGLIDLLGSNSNEAKKNLQRLLKQQETSTLQNIWFVIESDGHQLKRELSLLSKEKISIINPNDISEDINPSNQNVLIVPLPPIQIADSANFINYLDYVEVHISMHGVENILEHLSKLSNLIAARELYLVPENISWSRDGSFPDGPGEDEEILFTEYTKLKQ